MTNKHLLGIAVVQEHKRYHFTVAPIKDIEAYRAERKAFEEEGKKEFLKREALRRMNAHNGVANQDKFITFSEAEKLELEYRKTRDDDPTFQGKAYKPKYRAGHWNEDNMIEKELSEGRLTLREPEITPTLLDTLKDKLIKFISLAFEK